MPESRVRFVVIGTRGSDLAMFQARHVSWLLQNMHVDLSIKIKTIVTSGDKILETPLSAIGDKGLFVKEIENKLLDDSIDIAVHSCKDLPTELPAGLVIGACGEREDPRDVFIGGARRLEDIPRGARIGTSSLRRRSQLLALRPDLDIVDIRGNVDTRIGKIKSGEYFGTILAAAGVRRLEREGEIGFYFSPAEMVPAVGQGIIAMQCRQSDNPVIQLLGSTNNRDAATAATAERALMNALEGGCQVPIGAHAQVVRGEVTLEAYLGSLDGSQTVRMSHAGLAGDAAAVGTELAARMLAAGGEEILAEVRAALE